MSVVRARARFTGVLAACLLLAGAARAPLGAQATAAPARAAAADSLTAQEFGALVARLSEPGGYFDTDNLISNESSYLHPITALDRLGVRGGGYIGVGPDQNFSLMAAVEPRVAFMIDIRRDNLLHHLLLKALLEGASNRAEYLARWLGRPTPPQAERWGTRSVDALVAWAESTPATAASGDAAVRDVLARVQRFGVPLSRSDLATIERFHRAFIADGVGLKFNTTGRAPQWSYPSLGQLLRERDRDGRQTSYLASEARFQTVKSLQRRNLVIPVVGDLAGPKAMRAIGDVLRARGERVSVLYASNAEDYVIRGGGFARYAANVNALPRDARSMIVRSWFGGRLPESVEGHNATQLVQAMDEFSRIAPGSVYRYADLIATRGR